MVYVLSKRKLPHGLSYARTKIAARKMAKKYEAKTGKKPHIVQLFSSKGRYRSAVKKGGKRFYI